jgi:hypothetical protein
MPPCGAPFLTAKMVAHGQAASEGDKSVRPLPIPWRPISNSISIPSTPPKPPSLDEKQQRVRRDELAASAQVRYEEWRKERSPPQPHLAPAATASHHFPKFRERNKQKELAGEWSSADRVPSERERVERAVTAAAATYLQSPPYPKQGGGVKNVEFSYMSSGCERSCRQHRPCSPRHSSNERAPSPALVGEITEPYSSLPVLPMPSQL